MLVIGIIKAVTSLIMVTKTVLVFVLKADLAEKDIIVIYTQNDLLAERLTQPLNSQTPKLSTSALATQLAA